MKSGQTYEEAVHDLEQLLQKYKPLQEALVPHSVNGEFADFSQGSADEAWEACDDWVDLIWAMNVSHPATDALIAPYAHLTDGFFDVVS